MIKLNVFPKEFSTIERLPNTWTENDFKALLDCFEYGDISNLKPEELEEMCLLSIADDESEESAKILLEYVFGNELNKNQIANLSHEMSDEKAWEEYADYKLHEKFFNVGELLYKAFGGAKFPHPEAVSIKISIEAGNQSLSDLFNDNEAFLLLKILAHGMPKDSIINRLFKEQLNSNKFEGVDDILWQIHVEDRSDKSITFHIISSEYWFEDFKYVNNYMVTLNDELDVI